MAGQGGRRGVRAGLALGLALAAGGCGVLPREVDPSVIYQEVTGEIDAGRERPPGLDRPFPSLGTVPPRPDRPTPSFMRETTAALEAARLHAQQPVPPREQPAPAAEAEAPGTPPLPAAPPPPPRLAGAPPVPWTALPAGRGGTAPAPQAAPQPLPEPGAVPALPSQDMLAPPAAPRLD